MAEVQEALDFAAQKLGFKEFKSHQSAALRNFVQGQDLFVNLPTGFGKSGVFQAAPVVLDFMRLHKPGVHRDADESEGEKSLIIVILPLKALAVDHFHRVNQLGLKAADVTSPHIPDIVLEESSEYSIIFASPESLFSIKGKELLRLVKPRCCGIFVDESHCVAKW